MVAGEAYGDLPSGALSVLALSSRFDGRGLDSTGRGVASAFSTRSVESF